MDRSLMPVPAGGWYCFNRENCDSRYSTMRRLMSSKDWPHTRTGQQHKPGSVCCKWQNSQTLQGLLGRTLLPWNPILDPEPLKPRRAPPHLLAQ